MLVAILAVQLKGHTPGDRSRTSGALGLDFQRLGAGEDGQVGTPQDGFQEHTEAIGTLTLALGYLELSISDLQVHHQSRWWSCILEAGTGRDTSAAQIPLPTL